MRPQAADGSDLRDRRLVIRTGCTTPHGDPDASSETDIATAQYHYNFMIWARFLGCSDVRSAWVEHQPLKPKRPATGGARPL